MIIYIDEQVKKNCWNFYDSYGEICVHCGCCARDKKTRYEARIRVIERLIRERENFDLWDDDPEMRAVQEKNIVADLVSWNKELEKYRELLQQEAMKDT